MTPSEQIAGSQFDRYQFSAASPADNHELLELLRKNPIHMEMDYVMDKRDDFFLVHRFWPGSRVVMARNTSTGEMAGCLSLLNMNGRMPSEEINFQYITDLVRSGQEPSPLLMKKLLNYTFEQFFDTDFIFGLINAENKRARMFSVADILHYRGKPITTFDYIEIVPLAVQKVPGQYFCRPAECVEEIKTSFDFINAHYKNHLLYRPLDLLYWEKMCRELPDFGPDNLWMLFEDKVLKGAMLCYNPVSIGSLLVARMDRKSQFLLKAIRFIHRSTGLLFSPPLEGDHIKTLQIRHLAGEKEVQHALLRVANNMAYHQKLHSVSLLIDERETLKPSNIVVYRYHSLMYAGYKPVFADKIRLFAEKPVFFDITFS